MTIANDIIFLSLRNAGVNGIGQTPLADDVNDAFKVLNAWISELNLERRVQVNPVILPTFPDLTTDVQFWSDYEHVLLTSMSVRLRQIYALPPVELDVQLAASALAAFSAINLQALTASDINPLTPLSLIMMALRAAGRITDKQGVSPASQDVSDAQLLMAEMVDEWERERDVRVIPGDLPNIFGDINAPIVDVPTHGMRNAITLNLAVRLRDLWGQEVPKTLQERADRALQLIQDVRQQQIAPIVAGVPATVRQACLLALRMAGRINDQQRVSDTSADMNDATSLLVMMIGQWQRKRWLTWNEKELAVVSHGFNFYTIGPGEDFDTARPDRIHAAFVRLLPFSQQGGTFTGGSVLAETLPFPLSTAGTSVPGSNVQNPVDISLGIIEAREDWSKITIKDLRSIPSAVFYDSDFPVGRLHFWPVPPASQYELHIVVKASLPVYATLDDELALPPEYLDAVINNLALRIVAATPGTQPSPLLLGQARASLETIRLANSQLATLAMPGILGGRGGDVSSWAGQGLNQAWTTGGRSVLT